ncbi:MAG: protein-L-isoaspartate O-methyltransferase family protein [Alphaproteobacteria bacterium]
MKNFEQARTNMVDGQIHTAGVIDDGILDAFLTVPREQFVPEKLKGIAYSDEDIDIGQGRHLLEPITHARMLQMVDVCKDDVVLDIGCGAGYSSAILSPLVTTVIAVEHNKRQMDKAIKQWDSHGICNVVLIDDELAHGNPKHAPYSLIIINGAVSKVPDAIFQQLNNNGRLVTVIKNQNSVMGTVTLFRKGGNGEISSKALFEAGTPFLKGFEVASEFVF